MIICLCKGISDRVVRTLIAEGVTTFKSMRNSCDIGTGCGKCIRIVKKIIDEKTSFSCDDSCDKRSSESRAFARGV